MKTVNARLRSLRDRLGVREDVIAAIVVAVLGAGGLSFVVVSHVGTPAGAALAYMAAVDRADTDYVWSHSIVDSASTAPTTVSLFNRAALAAQLKALAHTRSGFAVQSVGFTGSGTQVTLTYDTRGGRESTSLVMRGGAPHSWPVSLEPAGLLITLPAGAGPIAVDGQPVEGIGDVAVAVFPGHHLLSLAASRIFDSYSGDFDVESRLPTLTRPDLSKVKLTAEGVADAKQATSNAIKSCAAQGVLRPSGCPQGLTTDYASGAVSWAVLGDPVADATVEFAGGRGLQASGRYLMRLTYKSTSANGTRVLAIGGPYLADLKWDGNAMTVTGFEPAPPAAALPQPAASEAQVLAALKTQFDSCLTLQAGSSDRCPQSVGAFYGSNFVWHANSDPLQGAAIVWDSTQGFYKVSGNFDFSVDYDSTPPYSPTRHYQDHSSGKYTADLYWDGSKAVFVGFE